MLHVILRTRYRTRSRLLALLCHLAYPLLFFGLPWPYHRTWLHDTYRALRVPVLILLIPLCLPAQALGDRIDRVEGRLDTLEKQVQANQVALASFSGALEARVDNLESMLWFILGASGIGGVSSVFAMFIGIRNRQDVKIIRNGHGHK